MTAAATLHEPLQVGPRRLANRLVLSPHGVNFGFEGFGVGDDYIAYLTRRSAGFGLTWVALGCPSPSGRGERHQPKLYDDRSVPGLARLADALRATGTEPGMQICHSGRQTTPALLGGERPVAPSAVAALGYHKDEPRELSVAEIEALVDDFAQAARRATEAGFTFVNLHFAHGYLGSQFLSPASNQRDDDYGGDFERRLRFPSDVLAAVRAVVPTDVAVDVRLNGADFVPGGLEIEDSTRIAAELVARGADAVHVSGGVYGSTPFTLLSPMEGPAFVEHARAIRQAAGAPTMALGLIRTPEQAAELISSGACDLVGVARPVIADPDWALKALDRVPGAVRPCLATMDGCVEQLRLGERLACQIEPTAGRELLLQSAPAAAPRSQRLLVVGAGPAGCHAAIRAAELGHRVTLVDRALEVGGQLRLMARTPIGEFFADLAGHYAGELARVGVDVRLGEELSAAHFAEAEVDHVLLATGSQCEVPPLKGVYDGPIVPDEDVLAETDVSGPVVVVGAARRAVAVALHLAAIGATVTLVDHEGTGVAQDATPLLRRVLRSQLANAGVEIVKDRITRVLASGVEIAGEPREAQLVVLASRTRSVRDAAATIPEGVPVTVIGDAREPSTIMNAVNEAQEAVDALSSDPEES